MFAHSIHLLLIPAILGCPLICGVGGGVALDGCCAAAVEPPSCCAACGAADREQSSQPRGAPHNEPSGKHSCQCICGGATLADAVQLDHPLASAVAWRSVAVNIPPAILAAIDRGPATQWLLLLSNAGATPGRLLRCLYSSLVL